MSIVLRIDETNIPMASTEFAKGIGIRRCWRLKSTLFARGTPSIPEVTKALVFGKKADLRIDDHSIVTGLRIVDGSTEFVDEKLLIELICEVSGFDLHFFAKTRTKGFSETTLLTLVENNKADLGFLVEDDLRDAFSNTSIPNAEVRKRMRLVAKPVSGSVCTIQAGTSNQGFISHIAAYYASLCDVNRTGRLGLRLDTQGDKLLPAIVSVEPDGWAAVREVNVADLGEGTWDYGLCSVSWAPSIFGKKQLNSGRFVRLSHMQYQKEIWDQADKISLPSKVESPQGTLFAHILVDRFSCERGIEGYEWETQFISLHNPQTINADSSQLPGWTNTGVVSEVMEDDNGVHWVSVKLDGCDSAIEFKARWTTPNSGGDGKSGIIFQPAPKTVVTLNWSGCMGALLIALSNVRLEKTSVPSPAIVVGKEPFIFQSGGDCSVQAKGKTNVGVGGELTLAAEAAGMRIVGQGVQMELRDSKVDVS